MLGSKPIVSAALINLVPTNLVLSMHYIVLIALPIKPDTVLGSGLHCWVPMAPYKHPHELCPAPPPIKRKNVNKFRTNKAKLPTEVGKCYTLAAQLSNPRNAKKPVPKSVTHPYVLL